MSNKLARYLQEHLDGEVTTSLGARKHFSSDGSFLKQTPSMVLYPRSAEDVRKACRFAWQLATKGHRLPITPRGNGTDTTGAAIGSGLLMVFGPHMDKLTMLNPRKRLADVHPGVNCQHLQQLLHTHGLALPATPPDAKTSLIGGAVGNAFRIRKGRQGESLTDSIASLDVVLANGEAIKVGPLNKQQLSQKLGQSNFEGEIYRELDALLEENIDIINSASAKFEDLPDAAGYNLSSIMSNGSFNLIPLFAGSQGTLGIITSISLNLQPRRVDSTLVMISLGRLTSLNTLMPHILNLSPASVRFINHVLLEQAEIICPGYVDGSIDRPNAAIHLLVEFNDTKPAQRKKLADKLCKEAESAGGTCRVSTLPKDKDELNRIFDSSRIMSLSGDKHAHRWNLASVSVPAERIASTLTKLGQAYSSVNLPAAFSGYADKGIIDIEVDLDLAQLGDRQKLFKLNKAIHEVIFATDGTISVSGAGRLHAPQIQKMYGVELYNLMNEVKTIFDPHGILNPGVKFGTSEKELKIMLNSTPNPHQKYQAI